MGASAWTLVVHDVAGGSPFIAVMHASGMCARARWWLWVKASLPFRALGGIASQSHTACLMVSWLDGAAVTHDEVEIVVFA